MNDSQFSFDELLEINDDLEAVITTLDLIRINTDDYSSKEIEDLLVLPIKRLKSLALQFSDLIEEKINNTTLENHTN